MLKKMLRSAIILDIFWRDFTGKLKKSPFSIFLFHILYSFVTGNKINLDQFKEIVSS
jgi:hypothetical protein